MSQTHVIYALSLDGESYRYVGLTRFTAKYRLQQHRYEARRGTDFPVYRWMRKHGPENVRITVLEVSDPELLDSAEIRWIEDLKADGHHLLNVTVGGYGQPRVGAPLSEEVKTKISQALTGRKLSEETKKRMSAARRNRVDILGDSCAVTGCTIKPVTRGWCEKHYTRWRRHGEPLAIGKSGPRRD